MEVTRSQGQVVITLTDDEAANLQFEMVESMGLSDDLYPLVRLLADKIRFLSPKLCWITSPSNDPGFRLTLNK